MRCIYTVLFALITICTSAQNIKTTALNSQDVERVVANIFGVEMHKFDLSEYLNNRHKITLYIDEYTRMPNDSLTKERIWRVGMGLNRRFVKDAEDRERRKGDADFNEDCYELTLIESLTLASRIDNDSTALLSFSFMPSKSGGVLPLEVISLEQSYMRQPQYSSRPFKFEHNDNTNNIETPLLLYGSHYYDETAKVMRFCGEKEIAPDLSSEIIEDIPHFYVIGIILSSVKQLLPYF